MLLWAGVVLFAIGIACFALDRRAVHVFHDRIPRKVFRGMWRTTDYAKGAHWLLGSAVVFVAAATAERLFGANLLLHLAWRAALAFLASLAAASAVLHGIKLVLGRRRPRDELEHEFYGFRIFHYDSQHDSFPSGHAMTIFCVAVILSSVLPMLAPLWFAVALYLALTRAFLNAHFLSDVFIGAAIGLIAAREVVVLLFSDLTRPWF
jgi:membrane-associated phospholipid phosphatase